MLHETGLVDVEETNGRNANVAPKMWSQQEDELLRKAINKYGERSWKLVAQNVPGRTYIQCLQRWKKALRPGLRKGHWSEEEDDQLLQLVDEYKPNWDWATIAKSIPGRSAKQCRERWFLNLDPSINHGPWSLEEDHELLEFVRLNGGKWSLIAKYMPGRTENSVKTRFYSLQRKEARKKKWTPDEDRQIINFVLSYGRTFDALDKQMKHRTKGQIKKRFSLLTQRQPDLLQEVCTVEKNLRKKRKAEKTVDCLKRESSTDSARMDLRQDDLGIVEDFGTHSRLQRQSSWDLPLINSIQEPQRKPRHIQKTLSTAILEDFVKQEPGQHQSHNSNYGININDEDVLMYHKRNTNPKNIQRVTSLEILQNLISDPQSWKDL